jgi:hypothetical protein
MRNVGDPRLLGVVPQAQVCRTGRFAALLGGDEPDELRPCRLPADWVQTADGQAPRRLPAKAAFDRRVLSMCCAPAIAATSR